MPQEHPDAIAVHNVRHGLRQPRRHLVARARRGESAGELEEGAGLVVAALGVGKRGGAVEGARRVTCVQVPQLALLGEELLLVRHRHEAAVVALVRVHVGHEPGAGQLVGGSGEQTLGEHSRLAAAEAVVVTAHAVFTRHAHGQQVARSAHGGGGPLGHTREDGVEVARGIVSDRIERQRRGPGSRLS